MMAEKLHFMMHPKKQEHLPGSLMYKGRLCQ